ncbi:MAG: DNA replication complex subunit Gins51 [Candidatus Methanospirareceae archaeon]
MDIEALGAILRREKDTGSLQELPVDFCEDVRKYFESLEAEKKEADERWSEHVEDEIRSARMKVEDIINRRIGKILKLASSGIKTPPKGMLEGEERVFEGVKHHVEEGKERLFALMLGEKGGESEARKEEGKEEKKLSWHVFKTDAEPLPAKDETEELHIVRILEDIPTFMGTDGRIYKVKREDVIMLPKTNAEILCKRGVAERFEGKEKGE